jgi:hypothetical protein
VVIAADAVGGREAFTDDGIDVGIRLSVIGKVHVFDVSVGSDASEAATHDNISPQVYVFT